MIVIDNVTRDQLPIVQKMAYRIWPDTFKNVLTNEQIDYMLGWMYSIPALQKQFDKGHQFILAMVDGQCAGYAAYEIKGSKNEAKLHKIYILPAMQGRGIGKILINEVVNRVKQKGTSILFLNVNRYNPAINFYEKLGFKIVGSEDNPIGNDFFMNDYVMAMTV